MIGSLGAFVQNLATQEYRQELDNVFSRVTIVQETRTIWDVQMDIIMDTMPNKSVIHNLVVCSNQLPLQIKYLFKPIGIWNNQIHVTIHS